MMHSMKKQRKICDSWYHQRWFRILLVIVGVDMIVLGVTFALGLDIISLIEGHIILRVLGGLAYVVVALFIIHYAMSYSRIRRNEFLLCQHCAHVE
ncbi:MAG: hypothetical protein ACJA2Z_000531 [Candidatus Paceibacteria bacterium]|jgi:hypothetical protein